MKTTMIKSTAIAVIALVTLSFTTIKKEVKKINTSESTINWVGKKITGKHSGTIKLKEGNLEFKRNKLIGGSFVVDMTSVEVTDMKGEYKGKLEGHLKSDDFFGTKNHKTATLKITNVEGKKGNFTVTGDLTIKGITKPITFNLAVSGNVATTKLKIDRTKYGIRYGSASFFDNLKDKAIDNKFELEVSLKF